MNSLWEVWEKHPEYRLSDTNYTMRGFSIAALRTNFYIKELDIMLDAGISGYMSPDHIFITHAHGDHIANIPFHLLAPKPGFKIQVYVPKESKVMIENYIASLYAANDHGNENASDEHYYSKNYQIIGVTAGEVYDLEIKGKNFIIEVIKCDHSVACVGYGFTETRQKLKKEYHGKNGKEIKTLKDQNIDITEQVKLHQFCFLGDTSKEVIKEDIAKYKTIIMECTFIGDDELERADITKHTHWNGICDFIMSHPENDFILYHFSQRYKKEDIQKFFTDINLPYVRPWISNA